MKFRAKYKIEKQFNSIAIFNSFQIKMSFVF